MKWISDSHGQPRRPWYDDGEIESIVATKLDEAAFFVVPNRVVDLEHFAEQCCGATLDQYATLPKDVLGATEVLVDGSVRINIRRDLTIAMEKQDASVSQVGRWRATLAHEIGHVILHGVLFSTSENQLDLFHPHRDEPDREFHCAATTVGVPSVNVGWREVQANKAMAAMLMPRTQFVAYVETLLDSPDGCASARYLIESVALAFSVSRQAASIRIAELNLGHHSIRLI